MAWILGLTGGIGSGKSTAAGMLASLGAPVVDADAISHSLTAAGGEAIPAVAAAFGPKFIDSFGAMDRHRMRELVFSCPKAKQKLEELLRPLIYQECLTALECARAVADRRHFPFCVFDCPLLIEWEELKNCCQRILVIDLSPDDQIARTAARSKLSSERIRSIIDSQTSRIKRIEAADDIIYNGGGKADFKSAINDFIVRYQKNSCRPLMPK